MDRMQKELASDGLEVAFAAVNSADATDYQDALAAKCDFPLFQDTDTVKAFGKHGGKKDDIYIYDDQGKLLRWLPYGGSIDIGMTDEQGYQRMKTVVRDFIGAP